MIEQQPKKLSDLVIQANQKWDPEQIAQLRELAETNTPTRIIALKLGKTESAIYNKVQELGISLKPVNQSPYNRE